MPPKQKRPPPAPAKKGRKRGLIAAIVGPVIALIAYRMAFGGNPVAYIDVTDESLLRRVFFSGEVWAVACDPLPENFEAVASRLAAELNFGTLDCSAKLPSGRSTLKRWRLENTPPVIFVANGVQTTQIPPTRSEYDLVREIRLAAVRRPLEVKNDETFRERCLAKPRCLLVLRGGAELEPAANKALDALAGQFTDVTFAAVDAAEWRLNFEGYESGESVRLRRFEQGTHRAVYFANTTAGIAALAHNRGFASLGGFLQDPKPKPLLDEAGAPLTPTLIKRPKKKRPPPPKRVVEEDKPKTPPETIDPAKLKEQRRQAERNRRDQMEREAEQFTAEAVDDDADDVLEYDDDVDDADIEDLDDEE